MGIRNIFVVDPRTELAYRFVEGSLALCRENEETLEASVARVDWWAIAELRGLGTAHLACSSAAYLSGGRFGSITGRKKLFL